MCYIVVVACNMLAKLVCLKLYLMKRAVNDTFSKEHDYDRWVPYVAMQNEARI